jgi:hypothetical protein
LEHQVDASRLHRVIKFPPDHPAYIHNRDVRPASMLKEFSIHDRVIVTHRIGRGLIVAEHDVRGVPQQRPSSRRGPISDRLTIALGVLLFSGFNAASKSIA